MAAGWSKTVVTFAAVSFCMTFALAGDENNWELLRNIAKVPNYREGGFLQHFKPAGMKEETPAVILVHGLFMNGYHMSFLAYKLYLEGYYCVTYDYPTRLKNITGHGKDFRKALEKFCTENPRRRIHIITHSMGGLLTRYAVGTLSAARRKQIKSILMLAPPNRGSQAADLAFRYLEDLCAYVLPVEGLQSHSKSECNTLPLIPPEIRLGIIAASHDPLVTEESAQLQGMEVFTVMRIQTHSSLPFSRKVFHKIKAFLQGKDF